MSNRHVRADPAVGFTLLELLVVLAVAGLLVALVPVAISAAVPGTKLKTATIDLAVTLRTARNRAISRGTETDVVIYIDAPGYAIAGETVQLLPSDIDLRIREGNPAAAVPANATQRLNDQFNLRFYPDGSTSGAVIKLNHPHASYEIDVDWLIGRVTISRATGDAYQVIR